MTIGGIEITQFIISKTKRIDAAICGMLYPAAVAAKAESIAGGHPDRISICTRNFRAVGIPMACMNPTVVTDYEIVHHTMRIPVFKRAK